MTAPEPTTTPHERPGGVPPGKPPEAGHGLLGRPQVLVAVLLVVVLAMSWQFITDASRAVPAFDTAFYQWRAELLRVAEPARLIELEGATGALAGGYRVAEPVLGATMRGVGGIGASTHTVVLSVLFRVLAAVGLAAFAWRHRRSWVLCYLTLLTVPAIFLLQRFFGFMDNFFTLSLLAGVLLLLEAVRTSWAARIAAAAFLFVGGLSHPTTVAIFLLALGAVAVYRLVRERSIGAVLLAEGPILLSGASAVALTAVVWLGGPWGPTSSFSEAAVPPPEGVSYFVNRSVGVLKNLQPFDQATAPGILVFGGVAVLIGLLLAGLVHLLVRALRDGEHFAEVTVAWTLPLAGMFGFLIGAAYPYFRFFNATLAPLLLVAVGMTLLIGWSLRTRRRGGSVALPVLVTVALVALLGGWWVRGLSQWNTTGTWLTPEIRTTMAAAGAYLETAPSDTTAVFVTDAQPGQIVPYGKYKEFVNATYAGLAGEQIDDTVLFFGRIEDFLAGEASTSDVPDPAYDDISSDTGRDAARMLRQHDGAVAVFVPLAFNVASDNPSYVATCQEPQCVQLSESGLYVIDPVEVPAAPIFPDAVEAARAAAEEAEAFATEPPGPFEGLGSTVLAILRLALLFVVPGWLFLQRLPERTWPESLALVPMLSITSVAVTGVVVLAVLRDPLSGGLAWAIWGIASGLGLAAALWPGRPVRRAES
ncbi:MAG: hypothetical protein ACRDI0_07900 [Actinomycetota bacterium]